MDRFTDRIGFLATLLLAAGLSASAGFVEISLDGLDAGDLAARFLALVLVALLIERAVEIGVIARFGQALPADPTEAARHKAGKARMARSLSALLSLVVAMVGIRVLGQFLPADPTSGLPRGVLGSPQGAAQLAVFRFADVIVTTLVLAGGAEGLHQVARRATRTP